MTTEKRRWEVGNFKRGTGVPPVITRKMRVPQRANRKCTGAAAEVSRMI